MKRRSVEDWISLCSRILQDKFLRPQNPMVVYHLAILFSILVCTFVCLVSFCFVCILIRTGHKISNTRVSRLHWLCFQPIHSFKSFPINFNPVQSLTLANHGLFSGSHTIFQPNGIKIVHMAAKTIQTSTVLNLLHLIYGIAANSLSSKSW